MQNVPLLTKTRELLAATEIPLHQIATESQLGYEWLRKFKADLIPDPSVNRVQILHDYLLQKASLAVPEAAQ
jgi:hypothetical protein